MSPPPRGPGRPRNASRLRRLVLTVGPLTGGVGEDALSLLSRERFGTVPAMRRHRLPGAPLLFNTALVASLVACGGAGSAPPAATPVASASAPAARQAKRAAWMDRSDENAHVLLDVMAEFQPEQASALGIELADERALAIGESVDSQQIAALTAATAKLEARRGVETDPLVAQDLAILLRSADLQRRVIALPSTTIVPHYDVSRLVFGGLKVLLDDQVPAARRAKALGRLRRYAGLVPGSTPLTEQAKANVLARFARPALQPPARIDVEKSLSTSAALRDGTEKLFQKYDIKGYEEPLHTLFQQLAAYDDFLKTQVLPRTRADFALPPALYALQLEQFGVDIPQAELVTLAHKAFGEIQSEMQKVAAQVAKEKGLPSADYRDVIRALKKDQLVGEAILPHYKKRLADVEEIIRREHLLTLPEREARIRLGTPAENAQQPAPHMVPPRLVGNTGEQGEFVLPLSIPAPTGSKEAETKYDDFTFSAASWTLVAHEARPGHELQFDSMVERGVSLARALFAFNSTNVEGWGLYSEFITLPFMPAEGQLISLQLRLQRAVRAFMDPELQQGKWTFESARDFLEKEVGLSPAFATSEVERYTFRSPGQATSYFYGFTRLRELRREAETKLGARFDARTFHDTILGEGLLPPDLMRTAVLGKVGAL
jgi:hypothetical protein